MVSKGPVPQPPGPQRSGGRTRAVFLVSRGTAARRGKKVGHGRCGVPEQRSGLLTDGAFREAVLAWPATGKRRMARPSATKKHRRVRISRYRTVGSSRIAPIDDRSVASDRQLAEAAATPTRIARQVRQPPSIPRRPASAVPAPRPAAPAGAMKSNPIRSRIFAEVVRENSHRPVRWSPMPVSSPIASAAPHPYP